MLAAHGGIVFPLQRVQISFTQDLLPLLTLQQLANSRDLQTMIILETLN